MRPLIAAAALLFSTTAAHAVILAPGSNPISGTTVAAQPNLAGVVLVDDIQAFSINATDGIFSGEIQSRVVRSIDGTLDFYWRIRNTTFNPSSPTAPVMQLSALRIGNFAPIAGLNGDYRIDGLGEIAPSSILVFPGVQNTFANFIFGSPLSAGESSNFMFLDTNARNYAKTALMDIAATGVTGISGSLSTYAPNNGIPEPAAWAMMLAGFGLTGAAMRRRAKVHVAFA